VKLKDFSLAVVLALAIIWGCESAEDRVSSEHDKMMEEASAEYNRWMEEQEATE